jgi:hypothetical protein
MLFELFGHDPKIQKNLLMSVKMPNFMKSIYTFNLQTSIPARRSQLIDLADIWISEQKVLTLKQSIYTLYTCREEFLRLQVPNHK